MVGIQSSSIDRKSLEIGEEKYVDGFHHYKYTIVGDMDQLSSVEADELVTKKHINKINDVQLILDSHLSIDQKLLSLWNIY